MNLSAVHLPNQAGDDSQLKVYFYHAAAVVCHSIVDLHFTGLSLQEREYVLEQIQQRPESPWRTNSMWTFKNEAKIFGSPMFDAAWARETDGRDPMPELIEQLTEES